MEKIRVIRDSFEKTDLGEDSYMLYCPKSGFTYVMNGIMHYIYENCDERTVDQIIAALQDEYGSEAPSYDEIEIDVGGALNELEIAGLIERVN